LLENTEPAQNTRIVPQQMQRDGRTIKINPKLATQRNPNKKGENRTAR
jgi:hypothetical protein